MTKGLPNTSIQGLNPDRICNIQVFFSKIPRLIRWIEQKNFDKKEPGIS